jgi:hypothetical protein
MLLNAAVGRRETAVDGSAAQYAAACSSACRRKADDVAHGPCAAVSLKARGCLSLRTAGLYC